MFQRTTAFFHRLSDETRDSPRVLKIAMGLTVAVAVGVIAFAGYFAIVVNLPPSPMGTGSPKYADHWRDSFAGLNGPDEAQSKFQDVRVQRFDNGDWLFGVCLDSHSNSDGGTIVLKDSTGRISAYFGHVCGPSHLEVNMFQPAASLEEFYGSKHFDYFKSTFREYTFH